MAESKTLAWGFAMAPFRLTHYSGISFCQSKLDQIFHFEILGDISVHNICNTKSLYLNALSETVIISSHLRNIESSLLYNQIYF